MGLLVGCWPGTNSIRWSTSHLGGKPLGRSSGNTSLNSLITVLASLLIGALLSAICSCGTCTNARYNASPCCASRLNCRADTNSTTGVSVLLANGNSHCLPLLFTDMLYDVQLTLGLCLCNHGIPSITSYPTNGIIANSTLSVSPPMLITHTTYDVTACCLPSANHTVLLPSQGLLCILYLLTYASLMKSPVQPLSTIITAPHLLTDPARV